MSSPISAISGISLPEAASPAARPAGGSFQDALANAVDEVEAFGRNASASVERLLGGEGEELHTTALAVQQAELAFDLFLQVRNKVVSAYQEIMRLQL